MKRYLVVGGAGSLEVAPGILHIDQPDFSAFAKAEATKGKEYLDYLRGIKELDLSKGIQVNDVLEAEAINMLATHLLTPLQIERHLALVFEASY